MIKTLSIALVLLISTTACNSTKNKEMVNIVSEKENSKITTLIKSSATKYKVGNTIEISFKATNSTKKNFTFLPWGTPLENKLTGNCFDVIYNNDKLPYRGMMVKRMAPTEADNITIDAGKTVEGKVKLNKAYDFSKKGAYSIQFKESHRGLLESNTIKIVID